MTDNVVTYTAIGSGLDDGPSLRAVISAASAGTIVLLPSTTYTISTLDSNDIGFDMTKSNIRLLGRGSSVAFDPEPAQGATVIRYTGTTSSSGVLARFGSRTANALITGGGFEGVTLDGNDLIGTALRLENFDRGIFRDMWVGNATTAQVSTGTNNSHAGIDYRNRVWRCSFEDISLLATGAAHGMVLSGNLSASGGENTHACTFRGVYGTVEDGTLFRVEDCDDLWFFGCSGQPTGTGYTWDFRGSSSGGHCAREVAVFGAWGLTGNGIIARATGLTYPARNIVFHGLSREDITNHVTIEPGAGVYFTGAGTSTLVPDDADGSTIADEFMSNGQVSGAIGDLGWAVIGGSVNMRAGTSSHPGIRRINSSASAGVVSGIVLQPSGASPGGAIDPATDFDMVWIVNPVSNDNATMFRIGLGLAYDDDPPANGIYVEKLFADTSWYAVCRNSDVETRVALGSVAANWPRIRIRRRNATTIGFRIGDVTNEADTVTIATNVPTATLNPMLQVVTNSSEVKSMDVDRFRMSFKGLAR